MAVNWTEEQKKAIEKSGCNLIVAAAAGSGKTAVLVEKIVNMVENGTDIDSLLVTTFTDAAAKKMKQEIGNEIKNRLVSDKDNDRLARQLVLLGRADICTIDSFCMKVVRANFHLLDIDPDFKIADNNEGELLRRQAAEEVFAALYESGDEDFYGLLECYASQRGDDALTEKALLLHRFIRTMPDYKKWLSQCMEEYENFGGVFEGKWGEIVKVSTRTTIEGCISSIKSAHEYALQNEQMESYAVPLKADMAALGDILETLDTGDFDTLALKIRSYTPAKGGRAKPKTPDEVKLPVSERREYVKERMKSLAGRFYYDTQEGIAEEMHLVSGQVRALCRLAGMIEERFFEIKKSRSALDFGDIEHLALKALTDGGGEDIRPSAAADELREKYEMILIDEYQDSNELQEAIFSRITRGDNIFMVGDIKQSIYRFRHTNPLLFRNKKDNYSDSEGINQRVIMSKNFRSRHEIIDGVNYIMEQNTSPLVGEITYDETEALNAGADYPETEKSGGAVEVHILGGSDEDTGDDGDNAVFGAEAEAVCAAKRIMKLMGSGFEIFDKKEGMRPVRYKDIVILMRSPGVDAQIFADILTSYGIPVFSDAGSGYFAAEEIELMLSLLSVIDNPMQDIRLLGVMRSAIGGFTDTELADIRLCDSKSDIYGAVVSCSHEDTETGRKCALFLGRLEKWRACSRRMEVHELIWYLYNDTGYFDVAAAGGAGKQKRANLNLLAEYAHSYEKTSFKGLFNFVNYAERIKGANRDVGSAKILGENQDVVRIMSIHKSKGLEFGVVFLARLGKKFNTVDLRGDVLMHTELGIGVDFIDTEKRYKYPTFIKRAICEKMKYEMMSEELRVLYVALTRAREKLILTMAPGRCDLKWKKWLTGAGSKEKTLPQYYTSSADGAADWIMGALARHEACRQAAPEKIQSIESNAEFEIHYYTETLPEYGGESEKPAETDINESSEWAKTVNSVFGYAYPYEAARSIPTKISVTEMKRIVNNELDSAHAGLYNEELIHIPQFLEEEKELSASQRGCAVHFIMQNLRLDEALDEEGIKRQIKRMLEDKVITDKQAAAADPKMPAAFFGSNLGKRMLKSGSAVREAPFEILIDASEINVAQCSGESVLLQGIIDCYFYENDEIVLIDYKTDYVRTKADIEKISERYRLQLELYARALEKITGRHVKEKKLYLFSCKSVVDY